MDERPQTFEQVLAGGGTWADVKADYEDFAALVAGEEEEEVSDADNDA